MPSSETRAMPRGGDSPRAGARMLLAAVWTLVIPGGVYLVAASILSAQAGQPLATVLAFDPDQTPSASIGGQLAAAAMTAGMVGFLFVSPSLLAMLAFRRLPATRTCAHVWSLVANSVALFVILLILRHTTGVRRLPLFCGWWLWTSVLFGLGWNRTTSPEVLQSLLRRWKRTLAIGLGCVLAGIILLFPEQALQCLNEDGTEAVELALSLRTHTLPAWELETWEIGLPTQIGTVVVNPSLVNSYWTCGSLTFLGDVEVAARLPYWIWWFAIFLVCCRLVRAEQLDHLLPGADDWVPAFSLGLLMLLVSVLFTFYVGYNPYMADVANPGVPNALFTLAVVCAFDCLRHRDLPGFTMAMVLASLVLHAGPILLFSTLFAAWIFRPVPRRDVRKWALIGGAALLLLGIGYIIAGVREGVLGAWIDMLDVEYLSDYLAPISRIKSGLLFAGYFVLAAGGIGVVGLFVAYRRSAWQRTVATTVLGYLLIVLLSGYKNLHYLGPLLPIPLVLWLSSRRPTSRWMTCAMTCGSVALCLMLSWPVERQTFTLNRQLGDVTTFATDSYLDAVQWGRIRLRLREQGLLSWDCDQHTWVAYSEVDSQISNPRPLLVTATDPGIDGFRLVSTRPVEGMPVQAGLFVRDPDVLRWMSTQRPLRPTDRYPRVFLPIASGPYSPHDNRIEEVRRLRNWW
jgi:hypothetical protein